MVFDKENEALEMVKGIVEIFFKHSATRRSRKETSIAKLPSSKRREINEMEIANLRAKKVAEQRLWKRQLE